MQFRTPRLVNVPNVQTLIDDIAQPTRKLALFFGVKEATVKRWYRQNGAPRAVLIALYWESSFGRAAADIQLWNEVRLLREINRCQQEDINHLMQEIDRIHASQTGNHAANSPIFSPEKKKLKLPIFRYGRK